MVSITWASYDYKPVVKDYDKLRKRIRELAIQRRRFGSPRIHLLLRREGLVINHKKTRESTVKKVCRCRKRKSKKVAAQSRLALPRGQLPNEMWSMDFVSDSIITGRRYRGRAILDDFTWKCPAIEVDTSLRLLSMKTPRTISSGTGWTMYRVIWYSKLYFTR